MIIVVNFSSGEINTYEGVNAMQYAYKRVNSMRRYNMRYGYVQDSINIYRADDIESAYNSTPIISYRGGYSTPLYDIGLGVRPILAFERQGLKNVREILNFMLTPRFLKLGRLVITETIQKLSAYDITVVRQATKNYNTKFRRDFSI